MRLGLTSPILHITSKKEYKELYLFQNKSLQIKIDNSPQNKKYTNAKTQKSDSLKIKQKIVRLLNFVLRKVYIFCVKINWEYSRRMTQSIQVILYTRKTFSSTKILYFKNITILTGTKNLTLYKNY